MKTYTRPWIMTRLNLTANLSQRALERDDNRGVLYIKNQDAAATVYMNFDRAAAANDLFTLLPGQTLLFDAVVPNNEIHVMSDTTTSNVIIGVCDAI